MPYTYDFPRPSVTVDCIVFGLDNKELKVVLIQRKTSPFIDSWALPGGFIGENEALDKAAKRELAEETGLKNIFLEQLFTFGDPGRDPRGHTITVAYFGLVSLNEHNPRAASDAKKAGWFSVNKLPELVFDHAAILKMALERLKGKVRYQPIGFELLPKRFTLTQLQQLYETILEKTLDKRNFRKKIIRLGLLIDLNETQQDVAHRAARLYSFDEKRYLQLVENGFIFEV
ncbi:MAG: NUDIX hydrolase [Calditrichaeota bacterium]|nr:MAG: NUDIX hydrolase [Calditrichota bacterium]